ncbi:MAG: molecular chaperone HtpG [Bacteroidetes bacterium]|nr:molecular chaperone HtpG [Bacteroidota bacterium]
MSNASAAVEVHEFKAEMKPLLHLIVHSLYTHPEVFLRELISNASDALNKLRFRLLTDTNILQPEADLAIRITVNPETREFAIEDSGIGMTREETIANIGAVAKSGTLEAIKAMREANQQIDSNLIGQFGVGFYSVFMVADHVTLETRSANPDSAGCRWESNGEGSFSVSDIEMPERGTRISFILKEEFKQFASASEIESIIKKYSNFVEFPVYLDGERINAQQALWQKRSSDISNEEAAEFYGFITGNHREPLGWTHISAEGAVECKALIFIPGEAPPVDYDWREKSMHLYANKILIQENSKELLPEYLRFVRGVADTPDLPLNVSRETVQSSPVMTRLRSILTGKILGILEDWAKNDAEKFMKFSKIFGAHIKLGINTDYANKERIVNLMRFESSLRSPGDLVSLREYAGRMKDEQKDVYYLSGDSRATLEKNPNLEYFLEKNIEVLLLSDPVDVFTVPYLGEYDNKHFVSADKADLKIEETSKSAENTNAITSLLSKMREILGDAVENVAESKRLTQSAATLVAGSSGLDPQMEKMMKLMDKTFTGSKKVLELNPNHKLIRNLAVLAEENPNDPLIELCARQLYEAQALTEGNQIQTADFAARMTEIMTRATER